MFKVGDKVKVVPTIRKGWNDGGLMEETVGMVGTVTEIDRYDGAHLVEFDGIEENPWHGNAWYYDEVDLQKAQTFKGNKLCNSLLISTS